MKQVRTRRADSLQSNAVSHCLGANHGWAGPIQCETSLQSNGDSHWLGANLESVLTCIRVTVALTKLWIQALPRWSQRNDYSLFQFWTTNHEELDCSCGGYLLIVKYHYSDVIMGTMVSQITSLTIVYSTVYSSADQRKHQSSVSLAFVWGIHRWPVNFTHIWPVTRKIFPFDDVIMMEDVSHNSIMNRKHSTLLMLLLINIMITRKGGGVRRRR